MVVAVVLETVRVIAVLLLLLLAVGVSELVESLVLPLLVSTLLLVLLVVALLQQPALMLPLVVVIALIIAVVVVVVVVVLLLLCIKGFIELPSSFHRSHVSFPSTIPSFSSSSFFCFVAHPSPSVASVGGGWGRVQGWRGCEVG